MTWNHRVLANEHKDEVYYQIHEVYYDNDIPNSYTTNPITISGDSIESIKWQLDKINDCLNKPVLSIKNFPNIYKNK